MLQAKVFSNMCSKLSAQIPWCMQARSRDIVQIAEHAVRDSTRMCMCMEPDVIFGRRIQFPLICMKRNLPAM